MSTPETLRAQIATARFEADHQMSPFDAMLTHAFINLHILLAREVVRERP